MASVSREQIAFSMQVQAIRNAQHSKDERQKALDMLEEMIDWYDEAEDHYTVKQLMDLKHIINWGWPL